MQTYLAYWRGGLRFPYPLKPELPSSVSKSSLVAKAIVHPKRLRVLHFRNGPMEVSASPHFEFAASLLFGHQDSSRTTWRHYIREQHDLTVEEAKVWEEHFSRTVRQIAATGKIDPLEVRVRNKSALVLDGFHRVAAFSVAFPMRKVPVYVLGKHPHKK